MPLESCYPHSIAKGEEAGAPQDLCFEREDSEGQSVKALSTFSGCDVKMHL